MKVGFFVCSNGYGHFMRVSKIANQLKKLNDSCEIDIFCEQYQIDKFQSILVDDFNYIPYKSSNINWNTYLGGIRFDYDEYMKWLNQYKDIVNDYDVVVSDNIVGLLKYRNDIILSSSFLWHDVMIDKFSNNPDVLKLYEFEQNLLTKYKPNMLFSLITSIAFLSGSNPNTSVGGSFPLLLIASTCDVSSCFLQPTNAINNNTVSPIHVSLSLSIFMPFLSM